MNPIDLSNMQDIIVPEFQASIWPLAWGYWLMIALGLLALISSIYALKRHRRIYRAMYAALRQLNKTPLSTQDAQILLKRVAMHYHGRDKVASLAGASWLTLLKTWTKPKDHPVIDALFASQYQVQLETPQQIDQTLKHTLKHTIRQCSKKREVADALL